MVGCVQLGPASHQARIGRLRLLDVVDVLDLRVRAEAIVVAAEVRLTIGEEDGLVLGAAECRDREVPPLREEEREDERGEGDRDVARIANVAAAVAREMEPRSSDQRVALGRGLLGAAVAGGGVATGSCPDLKRRMRFTTSLSSFMFSMNRI